MALQNPLFLRPLEGEWLSFHGLPVRILAGENLTGGAYCVSVGFAPPDSVTPPHAHTFDESFFVLSAPEIVFRAGNERHVLHEGDFLHIASGVGHQPINPTREWTRLLTICLPSGFESFQRAVGQSIEPDVEEIPAVPDDIGETMRRVAPKYGIDLTPPDRLFEIAPDIEISLGEETTAVSKGSVSSRVLLGGSAANSSGGAGYELTEVRLGPDAHWELEADEAPAPRMLFLLEGDGFVKHDFSGWMVEPDAAFFLPATASAEVSSASHGAGVRFLCFRVLP